MARKLATIQRIKSVEPVFTGEGVEATNLQLIKFESIGWQCIAKRGDFLPGDLAVYIEISTIVPDHPVFEFLRPRKFKIKTMKMVQTTLSQGLVMPVTILKEFLAPGDDFFTVSAGDDVTEIIGVTRYDSEAQDNRTGGEQAGVFPVWIVPKTDQTRIQSMPWLLDIMKDLNVYVVATLKYDGTSATFFCEDGVVHACSRNFDQKPGNGSVYWKIVDKYNLKAFFAKNPNVVIQGEITAPGIQKNRMGRTEPEFHVFEVWNRDINSFLAYVDMVDFCRENCLNYVDIAYVWSPEEFKDVTVDSLLVTATGKYEGTKNPREGIVIRPLYESVFEPRLGAVLSFKVINNEYLLGGGE